MQGDLQWLKTKLERQLLDIKYGTDLNAEMPVPLLPGEIEAIIKMIRVVEALREIKDVISP